MSDHARLPASASASAARPTLSRRALLTGVAGVLGTAFLHGPGVALAAVRHGSSAAASGRPHGRNPTLAAAPHETLTETSTPADLRVVEHHAAVPTLDARRYRLTIEGAVDRPLSLTLAELERRPAVSRICVLECRRRHDTVALGSTPAWPPIGRTVRSEWTGVPLSLLLEEAGAALDVEWLLVEAEDAPGRPRALPWARVRADAIVAYAQDGEPLRPERGFPVRLIVPGCAASMSVKWVRRILVVGQLPTAGHGGDCPARPEPW